MSAFSLGCELLEDGYCFGSPVYVYPQYLAQECCLGNTNLTNKDTCYIRVFILRRCVYDTQLFSRYY